MITVKYFASLKEIAKKEEDQFQLGNSASFEQLCQAISQTSPTLGDMVREKKVMVSVNMDVVQPDTIIQDGDEVALLPPFSGGLA